MNCRHFGSRAVRTPFWRVAFGRLQVDVGVRDPGRRSERAQQAIAQIFRFVKKHLEKEIPWKYVDWCQCYVKRDGTVKIEEYQR